ncbi:MAG: ATP-dependent helicase HrpB [Bacteroidales bacterium]|nr:ATP-dependent helicase HrpB [Bacteroidales bacterium]
MVSELIHSTGLPAVEIADEVNETLVRNSCVVVTAPPGAGKSTVLPLTILDGAAEAGKVIVLEPRRIAARQIAERMAFLSGDAVGGTVGYRVRFESRVSAATRVEVLTEGILTRMIVDDPTLDGVSVLIFDEFHERSLNCDLALALALRTQRIIRPDLRIVIMSATIEAEDICRKLNAPLVQSAGRLFPVENIYCEPCDMREAARDVARTVLRALREQEGDVLAFLPGENDIRRCAEMLAESLGGDDGATVRICPLYGMLPFEQQNSALRPAAAGERKVVLATPIAETSLTIEGIRSVVDSGLYRRQIADPQSGLGRLETSQISMDMARQRAGRAGRLGPGVCYRLWQQSDETRMRPCRVPEILEADLAPMMLQIAAWGGCAASELDWMSAPPAGAMAKATSLLQLLGSLDEKGLVTAHGRRLAAIPCHPRIANMLCGAGAGTDGQASASSGRGGAGTSVPAPDGVSAPAASAGPMSSTSSRGPALEASQALAADIAALLDERDPMARDTADTDISLRLNELRRQRSSRHPQARWNNIIKGAQQYLKLLHVPENNDTVSGYEVGALLATAYPERVARQQKEGCGHFLLANGETALVDRQDLVAAYDWIAVANMNSAKGGEGRIFLAAPLDPGTVPELIRSRDRLSWDARKGAVVAVRERNIGCLNLDSHPLANVSADAVLQVLCEAAPKYGLTMFDFSDDVANLQRRVACVAAWHPELGLPDLSTDAVLACADHWLPGFYAGGGALLSGGGTFAAGRSNLSSRAGAGSSGGGALSSGGEAFAARGGAGSAGASGSAPLSASLSAASVASLRRIDLCAALWSLLDYEQQRSVDRIAPRHIEVPSGSRIPVEYRQGAENPILRVRIQECFGMADSPRVDGGARPVLLELLSPGFKPVQLTGDLRSFWSEGYFEVRKELRRRYPKHFWPDNPLESEARRGVRK